MKIIYLYTIGHLYRDIKSIANIKQFKEGLNDNPKIRTIKLSRAGTFIRKAKKGRKRKHVKIDLFLQIMLFTAFP